MTYWFSLKFSQPSSLSHESVGKLSNGQVINVLNGKRIKRIIIIPTNFFFLFFPIYPSFRLDVFDFNMKRSLRTKRNLLITNKNITTDFLAYQINKCYMLLTKSCNGNQVNDPQYESVKGIFYEKCA